MINLHAYARPVQNSATTRLRVSKKTLRRLKMETERHTERKRRERKRSTTENWTQRRNAGDTMEKKIQRTRGGNTARSQRDTAEEQKHLDKARRQGETTTG